MGSPVVFRLRLLQALVYADVAFRGKDQLGALGLVVNMIVLCRSLAARLSRNITNPSLVGIANKDLDWKGIIDHIGVVVLVMLIRLRAAFVIFGAGQQGVLSRLLRCKPRKFPTSPRKALNRV